MFTNDLREASQDEVEIKGVDANALWDLVRYCYTGKVDLQEDTVETLLSTACLLQLPEVVDACCNFLVKQLHPSNCIGIRLFADSQGCSSLLRVAHGFTTDHFMEVIRNQEFLLLSSEEVGRLLASDDLNVPSEDVIFHAFIAWVKHDLPSRKKELSSLLGLVKLPLLTPQFIADYIETNPLFKDDRLCQELIMEALKYHLLPERRSALQSPRTKPRKSTVGALYAVGGMDSNKGATSIEKYDLRTDTWTQVTNMTGRRLQFGVAVLDNRLFVVGGRDGLKTLNLMECYDVKTKIWTLMQPMSTHRHGLGVGVLEGNIIYACGGHDGWSYQNSVERWDKVGKMWSYVAPMNTQRSTVGVAVLNNRLYAIGGRDGNACLRTVEVFDPHTNRWTLCAPMAKRRGGVGVGVVNGCIFACGGHDAPSQPASAARFDCVERYDPKTDTWTMVSSMSLGRDGIGVCLLGDLLFCVGGYDGCNYVNLVETYDSQTNEWEQVAPLNIGRAGACLVVIKNS